MYNAIFLATLERPARNHVWKKNPINKSKDGVIVCLFVCWLVFFFLKDISFYNGTVVL